MTALHRVLYAIRHGICAANSWQCSICGDWFNSDQPSQRCPRCS